MKRLLACTALLLVASPLMAAGPNVGQISADATWAAHVDVEGLVASPLATGALALLTGTDSPLPEAKIAEIRDGWGKLGIVKSATLYGLSFAEDDAVMLGSLTYDEAAVKKLLKIDDQTPTQAVGERTVYTFKTAHKGRQVDRMVCFYDATTIVGAATLANIKTAIAVLAGEGKALAADSELGKLMAPASGSFAVAAAIGLDKLPDPPAGAKRKDADGIAMMRRCQSLRAECGEADGKTFVTLSGVTAEAALAGKLRQMAGGFLALMSLAGEKEPAAALLAEGASVGGEGCAVNLAVQVNTEDLLAWLKAQVQKDAAAAGKAQAPEPQGNLGL